MPPTVLKWLLLFAMMMRTSWGNEPQRWTISYRGDHRPLSYGVRKLQEAFSKLGLPRPSAAPLKTDATPVLALLVSLEGKGVATVTPDALARASQLKPEGYFLINNHNSTTVLAKDGNGALYGTLELVRQLLHKKPIVDMFVQGARFPYRALKFNLPESPYRPGKATALHADTVRNLDFWRSFLDMMAQNKYNVLSLWQLHPWQFMVSPRHFPNASLPAHDLAEWRTLYMSIFKEAQDRGIAPYIVNWNIFVSEPFKQAYDKQASSDTDGTWGNGCTDEVVKVYNRESITQVIEEYPDLAGFGLTFGDRMHGMSTQEQVKWIEDVFFTGIKAASRPVKLIYRAELKAGTDDVKIARKSVEASGLPADSVWLQIKFNWSHGHSLVKLIHAHDESSGGDGTGKGYWVPTPTKYRITWMVRNEDFFFLRFGQADFIRRHIAANGFDFVGGYVIGSEGYIPAKEYAYPPNSPALTWSYGFQKQWLFYKQWGSLLYDPDTPDTYFESAVNLLYPDVSRTVPSLGQVMLAGYHSACKMPLTFASFVYNTWDFTLHSEGFLQPVGNKDKGSGGFVSVNSLADKKMRTLDPSLQSVYSFVHQPNATLQSPWQIASILEADSHTALHLLSSASPVVHAAAHNATLMSEINDIKAWAYLGLHFAFKLRGAVELEIHRSTKGGNKTAQQEAIQYLREAQGAWDELVNVTSIYMTAEIPLLDLGENYTFHWSKFAAMAEHDVRLAEDGVPLGVENSSQLIADLRAKLRIAGHDIYESPSLPKLVLCECQDFCYGRCFAPSCSPCNASIWTSNEDCLNPGPLGSGLLCQGNTSEPCCSPNGTACALKGHQWCDCSKYSPKEPLFPPLRRTFDPTTKTCSATMAATVAAPSPPPLPCHHGGRCPPPPPSLVPKIHNSPACLVNEGPHDMAAAITLPHPDGGYIHHIFQFSIPCDYSSPQSPCWFGNKNPNSPTGSWAVNNVGDAWHHATSRDLVSWENHGNQIGVYSGFVIPDEDGTICAGQRCGNVWCPGHPSCGDPRQTGCPGLVINGTGPLNGTDPAMVPVFITCATNNSLSGWAGHSYPFNPREYRGMAFDPQAWRDDDGMYYVAVATDACNGTTRKAPCQDGQSMYLWRAPRLRSPPEQWEALGAMITTKDDAMTKNSSRGEMVTPSFTGNLRSDPRGGATRLLTNNVCAGTTFFLGTQANGSRFLDRDGGWDFDGVGETGMIDWGAVVVNVSAMAAGETGIAVLTTNNAMVPGTCHAPFSMARTFGDPSGQSVATKGRKMMIGWVGNDTFAAQSLPRDLWLNPVDGSLRQAFIPELQALRVRGTHSSSRGSTDGSSSGRLSVGGGLQLEVVARISGSRGRAGIQVLSAAAGNSTEGTEVGVDFDSQIVFIDGRKSNSCDAMPWLCRHQLSAPALAPGHDALFPAGPLLGDATVSGGSSNVTMAVRIHCFVDGTFVSCIFNNQTAITTMVAPSASATGPVNSFGGGVLELESWRLEPKHGASTL